MQQTQRNRPTQAGVWMVLAFFLGIALTFAGCPGGETPGEKSSTETTSGTETTAEVEKPTDVPSGPENAGPEPAEPEPTGQDAGLEPAGPEPSGPEPSGPEPPPKENDGSFGLTKRVPNTTCKLPGQPASLASMKIKVAFANLTFERPVYITHAPDGTDRIFVVEQAGIIKVFPNNPAATATKTFLDIKNITSRGGNEEGLLGLAFHPQYKTNGLFYVYYSSSAGGRSSIVSQLKVSANDPDKADRSSEKKILRVAQPYSNHNGGMIEFGPDGYLYIALGDGGSGGDPLKHGQNLGTLLGTILRIDVDRTDAGKAYAIPSDNPFVNQTGALPEIYAYGLRNVWRFSFDRLKGTLWAGDVGQSAQEEIDVIVKGGNYGWRGKEGTNCYDRSICNNSSYIDPIITHGRSEAKSITGGYVYRGSKLQSLYGAYVYGDFVSGKIWALRYDGKQVTEKKFLVDTFKGISSFGEDKDGEIYFTTFETRDGQGKIYTLEAATTNGGSPFPIRLSQTGCFSSLSPLQPAPGLIPYAVNVPLWSDGLDKRRWFALPGTKTITYKTQDGWEFPDDTVTLKHFSYQATQGDENTRRSVETRIFVKHNGEWRGYSYLWNKEQTDAVLVDGNVDVDIRQTNPQDPNNALNFTHTVPNRNECLQCHTEAAGRVLGLETLQMNRNFDYNGVLDNQLRAMNHIKLFNPALPTEPSKLPSLQPIEGTNLPLDKRARSYLHANCAYCHRPGVAGVADTNLLYQTLLKDMKSCNVTPQKGDLGVSGAKILVPKNPDSSTLLLRMAKRGKDQMPQIGTKLVHKEAVALLRQWIQSIQSCP